MVILLLLALASLPASEPPEWVMRGILAVETRSRYGGDGRIIYVDHSRGTHHERGAFQMTPVAFRQICKRGERFAMLDRPAFAEIAARRYLRWLFARSGSWDVAVQNYNAGAGHLSPAYLRMVKSAN